jgi:hypothetical protein
MDENRIEELALMYKLLNRVNGIEQLKAAWNQYIKVVPTLILTHCLCSLSLCLSDILIRLFYVESWYRARYSRRKG